MAEIKVESTVSYEFAKDEKGSIVNINKAIPHKKYICANEGCKINMIPIFGQTGRAYHFRHENINFEHGGESILHYNIKIRVAEKIEQHIKCGMGIFYMKISKKTGDFLGQIDLSKINKDKRIICNKVTNLMCNYEQQTKEEKDSTRVLIEKAISDKYRPDISVIDKNNNILFVIEIVNTHDLEEGALKYLEENKVLCIKIFISKELDDMYKKYNTFDFWSDFKDYEFINFADIDLKFDIKEADEIIKYEKLRKEIQEKEYKQMKSAFREENNLRKLEREWAEFLLSREKELKIINDRQQELIKKLSLEERYKKEKIIIKQKETTEEYNRKHSIIQETINGLHLCKHDDGTYYKVFIPNIPLEQAQCKYLEHKQSNYHCSIKTMFNPKCEGCFNFMKIDFVVEQKRR